MANNEAIVVQALFSFKATNNDELCFKKGDLITVTQKDEDWWEGTFNGKTGWFPSNYVKECKDVPKPVVQPNQYKGIVLKDLIDSEKAHVTELEGLVSNFLQPLEKSSILNPDEYKQLTGNLGEVLETHQQLLKLLENEECKSGLEQRVGRLFLTWAPRMKAVHQTYCSLHPRAVCILDKYKDELTKYMETRGAASPGVLVLTTLLSKPFRRLDKYSGMLQELERHVEECHPDRGDTQRSVAIYKDMAAVCAATRRQKELELQVLTGAVRGWEGPPMVNLGEIVHMGSVAVGPQHHDRYFVLFPTTLVILSVSHRLSAFIYEGKLPVSGLIVNRLDDNEQYKNAFELSAPMIENKIAVCQSRDEANHWVELLAKHMPPRSSSASTNQQCVSPSQAQFVPQPPPHSSPLVSGGGVTINRQGATINQSPAPQPPPHASTRRTDWSATCLRPSPPLRPGLALVAPTNAPYIRTYRKPLTYKEDAMILDVIESYCCNVKPRNAVHSVDSLLHDDRKTDEKILNMIQNKLNILEYNVAALTSQLNEERAHRCALQNIVRTHLSCIDGDSIEWPTMESNI